MTVRTIAASAVAAVAAAVVRFETELRCVADRCLHVAVIDVPHSHPACPKCGGPVRLSTYPAADVSTTVDSGAVGERLGSEVKTVLADFERRISDGFTALEEHASDTERRVLARVRAELSRSGIVTGAGINTADAAPSNVREVIHSIDTGSAKPPEPPTAEELPPGSA